MCYYYWNSIARSHCTPLCIPLFVIATTSHDYVINLGNTPIVGIPTPFFEFAFIIIENGFPFAFLTRCPSIRTIGHFADPIMQTLHALDTVISTPLSALLATFSCVIEKDSTYRGESSGMISRSVKASIAGATNEARPS